MRRLLTIIAAIAALAQPVFASGFTSVTTSSGGTVTSVGVTTANGVSGSVANPTTTPAITVSLGAITPSSVAASGTVTGSNLSGTHSGASSGTNSGDQTITLSGDVTGSGTTGVASTVVSATGNGTDFVVASPNRVKVAGNPSIPTPASTDAYLFHTTANGLGLIGNGSGFDFTLYSSGGSAILTLPHGGTTITASNAITAGGSILSSGTAGVGYKAGAGGAVTQLTSRTTGVTLNTACGAITIFSAAGAATYSTFTVTDSAVAATDTLVVNQKSGTNLYIPLVTAIGAGSFNLSFATTGGTATDAPVFQFCVLKGANS